MALRHQGYLTQHDPGHGSGYWRLRFRLDGRLRAIYVGQDAELLDCVRKELRLLREGRHTLQRLVQFEKQARRVLRDAKKRLSEPLQQLGMYYHGDAIRKRRSKQAVAT
jgi:hypothetical protein